MKIGILTKQVPDSETKIKIKADGSGIDATDTKYIMNPYDEFAVEEALKLQAKLSGEVVVISFGPAKAEEAMRNAMAMGADRGVRVDDDGISGTDSLGTARLLAAVIKKEGLDIVFAGKQAIDDDASAVPQMVAELLGWPQVTVVDMFEALDTQTIKVGRRVGGGAQEVLEVTLPAVISADKGLNKPRFPSLPGIMKSKKKPLTVLKCADLGIAANELGANGSLVKITGYSLPPARKAGRILKGDVAQITAEVVRLLHDEARVI